MKRMIEVFSSFFKAFVAKALYFVFSFMLAGNFFRQLILKFPAKAKSKDTKEIVQSVQDSTDSEQEFFDLLLSPSESSQDDYESVDSSSSESENETVVDGGRDSTDSEKEFFDLLSSSSTISQDESVDSSSSESESETIVDEEQIEEEENGEAHGEIIDIDADDLSDPFMVAEYAEDIFRNMKKRENLFLIKPFMERKADGITPAMRASLIDWLMEVQWTFGFYDETLYLGVKLLDHYLAKNQVSSQNLQLVGAASLLISAKFEENLYQRHTCVDAFLYICDYTYEHDELIQMEKKIFIDMEYDINIPIPYSFLTRYAKAAFANEETLTLAQFVLESTLQDSSFVDRKASLLAASCLALAMLMTDAGDWTPTLVYYTGYKKGDLKDCILKLNTMISEIPEKVLLAVKDKYYDVAQIPPLDAFTLQC